MTQTVKVASIEPYTKELKRIEFKDTPYRIFKHPNFNSAYIVSKNGIVIGMSNSTVLRKTFRRNSPILTAHECNDFESVLVEFDF